MAPPVSVSQCEYKKNRPKGGLMYKETEIQPGGAETTPARAGACIPVRACLSGLFSGYPWGELYYDYFKPDKASRSNSRKFFAKARRFS